MSSQLISTVSEPISSSTAMELDLSGEVTATATATPTISLDDADGKTPDPKFPIFMPDGTQTAPELSRKACELSRFFRNILEDPECKEIRLKAHALNVKYVNECLRWMEHHETNPIVVPQKPLRSTNIADVVPEFDAKFCQRESINDVFEVMTHANYLQVTELTEILAAYVASLIKGRTPDEIKKTFHIERDMTPEDEAAIKREFPEFFEQRGGDGAEEAEVKTANA